MAGAGEAVPMGVSRTANAVFRRMLSRALSSSGVFSSGNQKSEKHPESLVFLKIIKNIQTHDIVIRNLKNEGLAGHE